MPAGCPWVSPQRPRQRAAESIDTHRAIATPLRERPTPPRTSCKRGLAHAESSGCGCARSQHTPQSSARGRTKRQRPPQGWPPSVCCVLFPTTAHRCSGPPCGRERVQRNCRGQSTPQVRQAQPCQAPGRGRCCHQPGLPHQRQGRFPASPNVSLTSPADQPSGSPARAERRHDHRVVAVPSAARLRASIRRAAAKPMTVLTAKGAERHRREVPPPPLPGPVFRSGSAATGSACVVRPPRLFCLALYVHWPGRLQPVGWGPGGLSR